MKKIFMALMMLGILHQGAEAQAKKHSRYDINYKVCRSSEGTYTICGKENRNATVNTNRMNVTPNTVSGEEWKAVNTPAGSDINITMGEPKSTGQTKYVPDNLAGVMAPVLIAPVSPNTGMTTANCSCPAPEVASSYGMKSAGAYAGYRRHNIVVSDDMNNPYQGKPSLQNDGVKKNEYRNLNVNQTSIILPASDGSLPK